MLLSIACVGVATGSYISAELLYLHYPDQNRASSDVVGHAIEALLSSPLSMTFGLFPTIGFYGAHGFLVIPGVLMAIVGSVMYYRHESKTALFFVCAGFVLWSHNNLLGFHALMSV